MELPNPLSCSCAALKHQRRHPQGPAMRTHRWAQQAFTSAPIHALPCTSLPCKYLELCADLWRAGPRRRRRLLGALQAPLVLSSGRRQVSIRQSRNRARYERRECPGNSLLQPGCILWAFSGVCGLARCCEFESRRPESASIRWLRRRPGLVGVPRACGVGRRGKRWRHGSSDVLHPRPRTALK